jgi:MoxR-like ATPase
MHTLPNSIDQTQELLSRTGYVCGRGLATVVFLSLKLGRPLFLEGEAGVGKTEVAKALAAALGRRLIRLQCYEGLDAAQAVYDWNYPAQMIEIRLAEAGGGADREHLASELFSERFLTRRPLLEAMEPQPGGPPVLLIDELDRTDEPFEAFLLEALSDFQVTVPELGTIKAAEPPIVIVTSNRTREVHDALKRRCLYHWVDYPDAERELAILEARAPEVSRRLSEEVVSANWLFWKPARPRSAAGCPRRWWPSFSACAPRTCSSAPALPKPSTGPSAWWRWMRWRWTRRLSRTRWGRCSNIRTISPGSRARRPRRCWTR